MVASADNHPPTKREIVQRRCNRKISTVAALLKEAKQGVGRADRDLIVMRVQDAIVELVLLGDVLEANVLGGAFKQLEKIDRLPTGK